MPSREAKRWQHRLQNKQLRGVRKQIRRNREPDPVRRKERLTGSIEELERLGDADAPMEERVMPLGERERRKAAMVRAMAAVAEGEAAIDEAPAVPEATGTMGVVVEASSGRIMVDVGGEVHACGLRGSLAAEETGFSTVVAVGDRVVIVDDGMGGGAVARVLPRRSALVRPDSFHGHLRQVIAANIDRLLIVASWREPAVWLELIDRYLIAAERNNLSAVVCLNKTDLASDRSEYEAVMEPYRVAGYRLVYASALTGAGVDELRGLLLGGTTVLAGLSGVGKSSLLNVIEPGLQLGTGPVGERDHLGRHTTTRVLMRPLRMGGYVVDTPGIRQFGLAGLRKRDLGSFYPELRPFHGRCRFGDCLHQKEPDCAVRTAIGDGLVAASRYDTYGKILASLPG